MKTNKALLNGKALEWQRAERERESERFLPVKIWSAACTQKEGKLCCAVWFENHVHGSLAIIIIYLEEQYISSC